MRATMISRGMPAFLLALLVGSCRAPQPMAEAPSTQQPDPATVGDLTGPVASLTGDSLWKLGRSLVWTPGRIQPRDCAEGNCNARMDAVRWQEELNDTLISPNGTIVARFVNLGGGSDEDRGPEARYGFAKSQGTEYYLIAIRDAAAPRGWSWILRMAFRGDQGTLPIRVGVWGLCQADQYNPNHPPVGTKTEFYKCNYASQNGQSVVPLAYSPQDPGWYDCEQGCCTADVQ